MEQAVAEPTDQVVTDAIEQVQANSTQQQVLKTFQEALNAFIKKVNEYTGSKSQLQRVLMNLAISPLNQDELHHKYTHEKELFELGTAVNSAKFYLMLLGLESQGKLSMNEDVLPNTVSDVETKKEGETNNG